MTVSLIHGNALTIPLASSSVHLVVTSPPYFALRSYRDDGDHFDGQLGSETTPRHFLAALWAVMDECWRVLRDDGSVWLNLGDKFAGSGGNNNAGVGGSKRGPSRYNQNSGGLRPKSRMLLPHRFALGLIDPEYRCFVEARIGIRSTLDPACALGDDGLPMFPRTHPQWICRMDAVWSKPNGLPESVTDRVRASHEYWFHLVKSERYYSALDAIREPHAAHTLYCHDWEKAKPGGTYVRDRVNPDRQDGGNRTSDAGPNPLGKLPGSVWEVATEPLILPDDLPQHFAAFPSEFPRRLVLGWSPSGVCVRCGEGRRPVCERTGRIVSSRGDAILGPEQVQDARTAAFAQSQMVRGANGWAFPKHETTITGTACACPTPDAPTRPAVVLDPFSGTGTTSIVASALGRHGVGVDLSWDYHRIARWRDQDGGLRAKALGVAKPEKQLDGQLSLLGEVGS